MANNLYTTTVTIANGASLSDAAELGGMNLVGILMPASWTAAGLTFQASPDGSTYGNVFDVTGTEVAVASSGAVAAQYVVIPAGGLDGCAFVKVRSGTSGSAVNQGAARTVTLIARRYM